MEGQDQEDGNGAQGLDVGAEDGHSTCLEIITGFSKEMFNEVIVQQTIKKK